MPSGRLYLHTLRLVRNRPASMTYAAIAEAIKVPESWLKDFASGRNDGASTRVELLWEYMTGRELLVEGNVSPDHYR
jgi:hypothetical protein